MSEQSKFQTILLTNKIVTEEQLKQITSYAHAVGIDLCEAALQKKAAPPETVMMAYAESLGLPFIRLADIAVDKEVATQVDPMTARQYSFVPISIDQGYVLLATTKPVIPDIADELRTIFNLPVKCAICLPAELCAAIAKYYPRDAVRVVKTERNKESKPVVKKATEPVEPMNDEEKKGRLMKTVIAFNFAFAFIYFASPFLPLPRMVANSSLLVFLLGAVVGGLVAGIAWRISSR